MQKQRVVTPGYKITHGATVFVTGQHSITLFLLSPTGGRRRIRFGSMVSLKLGQRVQLGPKRFPGPSADLLIPLLGLRYKILSWISHIWIRPCGCESSGPFP